VGAQRAIYILLLCREKAAKQKPSALAGTYKVYLKNAVLRVIKLLTAKWLWVFIQSLRDRSRKIFLLTI
jgi:hypothetical protein